MDWFFLVLLGLMVAMIWWAARRTAKHRKETEAYLREQGFRSTGSSLPEGLEPPANAWLPQIKISNCYTGMRNDFEVAVFQSTVPQGETPLVRTMVAVRRPPKHDVRLNDFMAGPVTIDVTSTPGWLIAAMQGSTTSKRVLDALLRAITAREGDEPRATGELPEKHPESS